MTQTSTDQRRTGWRRALIIAGAVLLPCCLVCLFGSEWGPSVGFAGLVNRLVFAAGFALLGVSMGLFLTVFVAETIAPTGRRIFWGSHAGAKGAAAKASALSEMGHRASPAIAAKRPDARLASSTDNAIQGADKAVLGREVVMLLLNLLIYGGGSILALGAFSSLDRANSFAHVALVAVVCAACVAAIILWRRHRVRSGARFTMLSNVGVLLLFAALTLVGLIPGLIIGSQVASDLVTGPRSVACVLQEFDEHHPTGRLAGFRQDTISLSFAAQDGNEVHVTVAEADRYAVAGVTEIGSEVLLTYYPRSGVLDSAELAG